MSFFSLDVNGNRWLQLVGSFAVTLALHFPAPVWALLLITACHLNSGVQKYSGYIYKGPGKISLKPASCFISKQINFLTFEGTRRFSNSLKGKYRGDLVLKNYLVIEQMFIEQNHLKNLTKHIRLEQNNHPMNNQKMKLMNDSPRDTVWFQTSERWETTFRSWTDCCSVQIMCFQESSRSRCKRITFGDKLSDTQPWIAETCKYAGIAS